MELFVLKVCSFQYLDKGWFVLLLVLFCFFKLKYS